MTRDAILWGSLAVLLMVLPAAALVLSVVVRVVVQTLSFVRHKE